VRHVADHGGIFSPIPSHHRNVSALLARIRAGYVDLTVIDMLKD
jgi:hypothetical protein